MLGAARGLTSLQGALPEGAKGAGPALGPQIAQDLGNRVTEALRTDSPSHNSEENSGQWVGAHHHLHWLADGLGGDVVHLAASLLHPRAEILPVLVDLKGLGLNQDVGDGEESDQGQVMLTGDFREPL